jgi:hypothetical protein
MDPCGSGIGLYTRTGICCGSYQLICIKKNYLGAFSTGTGTGTGTFFYQ